MKVANLVARYISLAKVIFIYFLLRELLRYLKHCISHGFVHLITTLSWAFKLTQMRIGPLIRTIDDQSVPIVYFHGRNLIPIFLFLTVCNKHFSRKTVDDVHLLNMHTYQLSSNPSYQKEISRINSENWLKRIEP